MPSKKTKKRPMTVSIHGDGIDIDAKFADSKLSDVLTKTIQRMTQYTTPPFVQTPRASTVPDDFDASRHIDLFRDILKKSDLDVVQDIADMVNGELASRRAPGQSDDVTEAPAADVS